MYRSSVNSSEFSSRIEECRGTSADPGQPGSLLSVVAGVAPGR